MFRALLILFLSTSAIASTCRDPFAFNRHHFSLIEDSACHAEHDPTRFWIAPSSEHDNIDLGYIYAV